MNKDNLFLIEELTKLKNTTTYHVSKSIERFIGSIYKFPMPVNKDNCTELVGCGPYLTNLVYQIDKKKELFGIPVLSSKHKVNQNDITNNNNNNNSDTVNSNNDNGMNEIEIFLSNYNPPNTIQEWLESIKCTQYLNFFNENGFTDIDDIDLIDQTLFDRFPKDILYAHQKRILQGVEDYKKFQECLRIQSAIQQSSQQNYDIDESDHPQRSPVDKDLDHNYEDADKEDNADHADAVCMLDDIILDFKQEFINLNLNKVWPSIDYTYLKKKSDPKVYQKAKDETIATMRIKYIELERTTLNAVVYGSTDIKNFHRPEYKVDIEFGGDFKSVMINKCTCSYKVRDKHCKHICAILIFIRTLNRDYQPSPDSSSDSEVVSQDADVQEQDKGNKRKKRRKDSEAKSVSLGKKPYTPAFMSGPWAFMMALYISTMYKDQPELKKNEILVLSAEYNNSESSECWASMQTLIKHELVVKRGNPHVFKLTPKGCQLGKSMYHFTEHGEFFPPTQEDNQSQQDFNVMSLDIDDEQLEHNNSTDNPDTDLYHLKDWSDSDDDVIHYMLNNSPLTKEQMSKIRSSSMVILSVILLVDNREIKGRDQCNLLQGLSLRKIPYELRTLPLGDFVWVANVYSAEDPYKSPFEVVFNVIIERKRLIDLKESHTDGRYADQKYRLARCGINKVLYLIEGDNAQSIISKPFYEQCLVETSLYDHFLPVTTNSEDSTVLQLDNIHKLLEKNPYQFLTEMTFDDFVEKSEHLPASIGSIFAQTLLTITGMTQGKATAILLEFPTQKSLYEAYHVLRKTDKFERENLLALLKSPDPPHPAVGVALSKTIYQTFYNAE